MQILDESARVKTGLAELLIGLQQAVDVKDRFRAGLEIDGGDHVLNSRIHREQVRPFSCKETLAGVTNTSGMKIHIE